MSILFLSFQPFALQSTFTDHQYLTLISVLFFFPILYYFPCPTEVSIFSCTFSTLHITSQQSIQTILEITLEMLFARISNQKNLEV